MYALEKKNNNQAADCNSTQCPRVELDKEDILFISILGGCEQ